MLTAEGGVFDVNRRSGRGVTRAPPAPPCKHNEGPLIEALRNSLRQRRIGGYYWLSFL